MPQISFFNLCILKNALNFKSIQYDALSNGRITNNPITTALINRIGIIINTGLLPNEAPKGKNTKKQTIAPAINHIAVPKAALTAKKKYSAKVPQDGKDRSF